LTGGHIEELAVAMKEEHGLSLKMRRIFVPKEERVTKDWRK
jgi:hypothetical protein